MRLTTRTNLAMRTLMFCAVNPGRIVRKQEAAEVCNASENHLAQIINHLARIGVIETVRGRHGGFRLRREPSEITVGEVFRELEAGVPFAECFAAAGNTCPLTGSCRLRAALERALEAFYATLDPVTLDDLVTDNCALGTILTLEPLPAQPCGA
ncbi:Rrf2 family transcriptional regulator [Rhodobacteraceae bacterium WD3A24]|nr:Rrf2 family transcriptional regulator [Rhodobacteraceae bacterium WD3A24]